ncbi:cyclase family protein [Sinanaerobacter chloroacetimidivorans]|uniref:Cyclase family protein n=1 Tax=Sinanaerobacter chloroacetimidivorans TaxID=2818044 RepID=A0A8J7VZC5_9FIRM|nr:cyclase family protein [Sinanaerobacter chloroacetimidivorans]MBR0597456.1 cyclase family protein [Sinanaerobacter chloroacetimidivorans]
MSKVDKQKMELYAEKVKNWNKWGENDELGTLNYIDAQDIVYAAQLVKTGKVFPMAIPLDVNGPQWGERGRTNPHRTMVYTGTDALLGRQDFINMRYADDVVTMPLQCATHWDALGHVFYEYYEGDERKVIMWNGYSAANVDSYGCHKCGIQNTRDKLIGRGILLDMARFHGVESMDPGQGITSEDLTACAEKFGIQVKQGDFVLVRTGFLGKHMKEGVWGKYAGGDAPGLEFETLEWLHKNEVAAVATDTWGVEVRPNRSDEFLQPWHWLAIPMLGITMGENFFLDGIAEECAKDGSYEFLFVAPSLPFTNGAGSPTNPLAVK